jgi:D-lactate dehydrogenase
MQVYFYEAFAEEAAELKRHLPAGIEAGFTWKTIQEAGEFAPPARLISIRTQSVLPATWHDKLAGIISRTTGYDTVTGLPVPCGYLPLYCNRAVAEQAMLLWMALLRRLPEQMAHFATFNRDGLTGVECAGKNLLVVGVGHVGSEVVKIGNGLGLNVRRVDLNTSVSDVSIADGLPWADIIVCSMNLTPQNRGYFNYDRLKQAKRGALFINVARGEMSPTTDLARLLDEGHLGGVALDVYENEQELAVALRAGRAGCPQPAATQPGATPDGAVGHRPLPTTRVFPLADRANVICTPHNAFNTSEAVARKSQQTAQAVVEFLKSGKFPWPVP